MPWINKNKTASDWKPVRVRKEWLDVVREAGELQPKASPTLDLTTCSEPKLLEYACRVAASYILGWFDPVHQKELVDSHQLKTVQLVARFFGGFGQSGRPRVDIHRSGRGSNLLSQLGYDYLGASFR